VVLNIHPQSLMRTASLSPILTRKYWWSRNGVILHFIHVVCDARISSCIDTRNCMQCATRTRPRRGDRDLVTGWVELHSRIGPSCLQGNDFMADNVCTSCQALRYRVCVCVAWGHHWSACPHSGTPNLSSMCDLEPYSTVSS